MGSFKKNRPPVQAVCHGFIKPTGEMSLAVGLRSRVTGAVVGSCQLLFYSPTPRLTAKCQS